MCRIWDEVIFHYPKCPETWCCSHKIYHQICSSYILRFTSDVLSRNTSSEPFRRRGAMLSETDDSLISCIQKCNIHVSKTCLIWRVQLRRPLYAPHVRQSGSGGCNISQEINGAKHDSISWDVYQPGPLLQGDCTFVQLSACTITRVNDNLNREAVVNATYCPDFCIQGTTGHSLTVSVIAFSSDLLLTRALAQLWCRSRTA